MSILALFGVNFRAFGVVWMGSGCLLGVHWGILGWSRGSWRALGEHVGRKLAPRTCVTDFLDPTGVAKGRYAGRHLAAKLGHFGC